MTTYAILAAILGLLGYIFGLKRKAKKAERERDAERVAKEQAQGKAEVAEKQEAATKRVDAQQAEAREVARERATDPAVVNAPTPAAQVEAAVAGLLKARKEAAAGKVRRLAAPKKAGRK